MHFELIWIILVVSLVLTTIGFYKFVYFLSIGYGFAVAGGGIATLRKAAAQGLQRLFVVQRLPGVHDALPQFHDGFAAAVGDQQHQRQSHHQQPAPAAGGPPGIFPAVFHITE